MSHKNDDVGRYKGNSNMKWISFQSLRDLSYYFFSVGFRKLMDVSVEVEGDITSGGVVT